MDDYDDDEDQQHELDDDDLEILTLKVRMIDGTRYEIEVINPDMTRFDRERARRKFGTAKESPVTWMTFVAWAALTRTRQLEQGMPYEAFDRSVRHITKVDSRVADPTPPDPGPG